MPLSDRGTRLHANVKCVCALVDCGVKLNVILNSVIKLNNNFFTGGV